MRVEVWERELPLNYPNRSELLQGIREGFHIVDTAKLGSNNVEVENYPSVTDPSVIQSAADHIKLELNHGHYKITDSKPLIISELGAIPKRNSKLRLIHDCSRPVGNALNDFAVGNKFQYQTLQDAIDLINPGSFVAKLDLAQAYRVVRIHPSNYPATGLKFTFPGDTEPTYMVDTRLPFGASRSPEVFNSLTQAVRSIMEAKGFPGIVAYLDDFLIVSSTFDECLQTLNTLITLLRQLGFWINYNKVEGPVQRITFLGIILDTVSMKLQLPSDKLQDLYGDLTNMLSKPKVSKKSLQKIAGKMNWAVQCIYGGRFYLRRILDSINTLKKPWHRTRVTSAMRQDIHWWIMFMESFNGTMDMVEYRPVTPVFIDACNTAAGAFYGQDWTYTPWNKCWPAVKNHHINFKEVLALEPAVQRWAPLWRNRKVLVHTDNQTAAAIINKGSCRDKLTMASLRRIFWLSAVYNFRIYAIYLPGVQNTIADCVSRLHEAKYRSLLRSFNLWPPVSNHTCALNSRSVSSAGDGLGSGGKEVHTGGIRP